MYNKPVQTEVATADKAITNEPTFLYWVFIEPKTSGAFGTVKVRDGFSTSDKEVARFVTEHGRMFPCYPPVRCAGGLYVDMDAEVRSYTVGYRFERLLEK